MRILMVHNYYQKSGGESAVFDADKSILEAQGHQVILYTRHNEEIQGLSRSRRVLSYAQMVFSFKTYREIRQLVHEIHPEVALVQNVYPLISPSVYYALQQSRLPVIQLVHQHRFVCVNAQLYVNGAICELCTKGNFIHSIPRRCYRNNAVMTAGFALTLWLHHKLGTFRKLIKAFIVPDLFTKQKLVGIGLPAERIFTNTNPFTPPTREPPAYGSGDYILFIGRFELHKGPLTLVRAMKEVQPDIKLVMLGQGDLKDRIEEQIKFDNTQNRIKLLPPVWGHEFADVISKAKFVIVPSEWYDNGILIPYYAFGYGKPVVASRIHGLIEEVDNEVDGLLYEPGNSAALAKSIDRLWQDDDLLQTLSRNARRKAVTILSEERHYQKMLEIVHFAMKEQIGK